MSVYNPPTFEEYLSVFNPADWGASSSSGLDIAYLDANYLKFPIAQGAENLQTTTINGDLIVSNPSNRIKFKNADTTNNGTNLFIVNSTNPIATSVGATSRNNLVIGGTTAGKILANPTDSYFNIAIGNDALSSQLNSAGDTPAYNVAVGVASLQALRGFGAGGITNTAIGYASLLSLQTGTNNFGAGYASGLELVTGDNNTFIGTTSGLASGLAGNCSSSIVIGSGAKATASSQVYIGGASTNCVLGTGIPLTFEAPNTNLSTGINYRQVDLAGATTYTFPISALTSNLRFTNSANYTVNLNASSQLTAIYQNKPFWLTNASSYQMTIDSNNAGNPIQGKYGSNAQTLVVEAGGVIGLYYASTHFSVFYKDSQSIILSSTTVDLTNSIRYLQNSIVRLTPSANQTITLPQLLTTTTDIWGSTITFINSSLNTSTLTTNIASRFGGLYGTQTANYIIYPNTQITIQPNQTNLGYDILTRDLATITLYQTYTGATITYDFNQIDSVINLSGSVATTINLPDPRLSVNNITGRSIQMFNNGSAVLSISATNGNFTGSYGSSASTISLQDNTWYKFTSNGTTWDINERSSNITFNQALTGGADFSNVYAYTDATLRITSSAGAFTVIIPSPTTQQVHATTSKFVNNSIYTLTLSIGAGTFTGKYGSGASTLLVAPNTFVEYYSDGANYYVEDRTASPVFNRYLEANGSILASTMTSYLDGILTLNPPDATIDGSPTNLVGTGTQSSNTLTVATITSGYILAGSVITLTGKARTFVIAQISGTAGGVGNYIVNVVQTQVTAVAFSGKASGLSTAGATGTATQVAFSSQTTNIPTAPLIVSSGSVGAGTSIYFVGQNNYQTYLLSNVVGGGSATYSISSAVNTAITVATTFWATKNNIIQLPNPSSALNNRRITITNNSYIGSCINTLGVGNVFGGQYGSQQSSAFGWDNAVNSPLYVLLPSRTVVLECDGTNWNAITNTTVSATKVFRTNAQVSGGTDFGFTNVSTPYTYNCNDAGLNALQFTNDGAGSITNTSGFPMTLLVSAVVNFANFTAVGGSIQSVIAGITTTSNNYTNPTSYTILPVFQTLSAPNFAPVGTPAFPTHTVNHQQTITLNPADSFRLQISKLTGSGTTVTINTGYITCQRLF
jgi:hypothetical protein